MIKICRFFNTAIFFFLFFFFIELIYTGLQFKLSLVSHCVPVRVDNPWTIKSKRILYNSSQLLTIYSFTLTLGTIVPTNLFIFE